jgi:hypothetical protein
LISQGDFTSRGKEDPVQLHSFSIGDIKLHIVSLESQTLEHKQVAANLSVTGGGGVYSQGDEQQYNYLIMVESGGSLLPYDIWSEAKRKIVEATGLPQGRVKITPKE